MRKWLVASLLTAGLAVFAAPLPRADDKKDPPAKKEQPKKKQNPKYADPAKVDDPDVKIQGEYVGGVGTAALGAQVVALGGGQFDVRVLEGGLPGAGWDGKTQRKASAKTENGRVTFTGKDLSGSIADGTLSLANPEGRSFSLKRVERKSPTLGQKPPEGAVVLFGGPEDVDKWNGGKVVELSDGKFLNIGIKSKQSFKDFKLHLEFRLPYQPYDRGQGRANSGVFLQDRYEVQVLDSFGLKGENNECGALYGFKAPEVNMCLPPLQWQTYDVELTAARFGADGARSAPAKVTVYHNGVKVIDNLAMNHESNAGAKETDQPGPFQLQNHGDPLVYRNIWVVETK
jgi:3-keto-disaccharide hydrolase